MNALIVEDKEHIRKGLIHMLSSLETEVVVLGECGSVKEAAIVVNACKPDLVFLDINLKDGSGFDFLELVEQINFKVIFITAYEEFALKSSVLSLSF